MAMPTTPFGKDFIWFASGGRLKPRELIGQKVENHGYQKKICLR